MQVSNIRTSHGNKGFEIRVSFGKHGSWGIRCRDKCGIVACQARLRDLKRRLQYLTNEFILIETWYPEQREVSARHMLQFLFRHDKTNMEEAVRCFLTAEQSDDWDSFYSRYFRELEWIGEASSEEVQYLLGKLYLTKHYKRVLQELTGNRYLETVLFLRMLMETGIRPRDVYQMSSACLKGKKVKGFFLDRKENYYRGSDGSPPQISKATMRIAAALDRVHGTWFTKSYDYYVHMLQKIWNQPYFSLYMLRRYKVECERKCFYGRGDYEC